MQGCGAVQFLHLVYLALPSHYFNMPAAVTNVRLLPGGFIIHMVAGGTSSVLGVPGVLEVGVPFEHTELESTLN